MTFREFFNSLTHLERATGIFKDGTQFDVMHALPLDNFGKKTIFNDVFASYDANTETYTEASFVTYVNERFGGKFDIAFTAVNYFRQFSKLEREVISEHLEKSMQYN